jgi:hypothetical protein
MSNRRAVLYRETGKRNYANANILTCSSDTREPDSGLSEESSPVFLDVHCGQLWIADMPDLTKHNEAYLEVTVVSPRNAGDHPVKVPYQFKLQAEVDDMEFSRNIAGAEILSGIQLEGTGIEFHCRLTELDKLETDKFKKIQSYLKKSDIASMVAELIAIPDLSRLPVTQLFSFISDTSEIIDELNDDDRLWLERPKLDLRAGSAHPLYEGWYAFVDEADHRKNEAPYHLYEVNGELYLDYKSDVDHKHLNDRTYFTWQVIAAN